MGDTKSPRIGETEREKETEREREEEKEQRRQRRDIGQTEHPHLLAVSTFVVILKNQEGDPRVS